MTANIKNDRIKYPVLVFMHSFIQLSKTEVYTEKVK
jgi:hypothetical protein